MKKLLIAAIAVLPMVAALPAAAQKADLRDDRREIQRDKREIAKDKQELARDKRELARDKRELARDRKELAKDKPDAAGGSAHDMRDFGKEQGKGGGKAKGKQ